MKDIEKSLLDIEHTYRTYMNETFLLTLLTTEQIESHYREEINKINQLEPGLFDIEINKFVKRPEAIPMDEYSKIFKRIFDVSVRKDSAINMGITYEMAIWEGFNKQFFSEIIAYYPSRLKTIKKWKRFDEEIDEKCTRDFYRELGRSFLDKRDYSNIDNWGRRLKSDFSIPIKKEFDKWQIVRECYYRRNDIVHHSGNVSDQYVSKMGIDRSQYSEHVNDIEYFVGCYQSLVDYYNYIVKSVEDHYGLDLMVEESKNVDGPRRRLDH